MTLNIESIWKEYREQLLKFVEIRVKNPVIAEDIIQDVFLKIHYKIDLLQSKEKIQSWLYQITRNTIIDYYRVKRYATELPEDLPEPIEDTRIRVLQELSECLMPMINRLPAHYKDAIILFDINRMSHRDISRTQGISLSCSKSRVHRGRTILKKMLTDCCQFEYDHNGRLQDYEKKSKSCTDC